MISCSSHHYPQVVFLGQEKLLWNPILKKAYKHLPEERVRLAFVEYLTLEANFSKNRISFESPVRLPGDKGVSRTDLLCYDEQFKPLLLVECKSRDVFLNEKTALQIARYNQKVNAPFLLVTNGIYDYWYSHEGSQLKQLAKPPSVFHSKNETSKDVDYWMKRGFAGKGSFPDIKNWVVSACGELYTHKDVAIHYLKFRGSQFELEMANYYRIFAVDDINLAVAVSSTPQGTTRLNVVMNRHNINVGIVTISLDSIVNKDEKNTILTNSESVAAFDATQELGFSFGQGVESVLEPISRLFS